MAVMEARGVAGGRTPVRLGHGLARLPPRRRPLGRPDRRDLGRERDGRRRHQRHLGDSQIIDPRDGLVTGTPGGDTLFGHDLVDDLISGLGGNDWIYGLGGNDGLEGGTGADHMFGGAGNDSYYVDNAGDV